MMNLTGRTGKRRSRSEIKMDTLRVISEGESKKTRIMYRTNTCYKTVMNILDELISSEFIEAVPRPSRYSDKRFKIISGYQITDKGKNMIRYINSNRELVGLLDWANRAI